MFNNKIAILMIHGFVGGTYDFGNLHNELQTYKNFDVFTYTLPGHNKLIVKDVEFMQWLDESTKQIEFILKNGYKEIYLIGHSMGGTITAYLASHYKEITKIVLAAPAFKLHNYKDGKINIKLLKKSLKKVPEILKEFGTEEVISKIIKTPFNTTKELTKLIEHCLDCVNYITCDTLTIHGTLDTIVPSESTEYVYNSIKSETNILLNVENLNHDCFLHKRSNEVTEIIKSFLLEKQNKRKEIITI